MRLIVSSLLFSQLSWLTALVSAACNSDNCARAVTGTFQGSQSAHKQDCSSFFKATVYPATVTSTSTQTVYSFTATKIVTTSVVSQTSTVYPSTVTVLSTTSTATQSTAVATVQTTVSEVTISTITGTTYSIDLETTTSTDVETATIVITQSAPAAKVKRTTVAAASASTVQPTNVPAYASPCSGVARYSSACSCFGVSKTTVTMPTPTVTTVTTKIATTTVTVNTQATSTATVSGTTTITQNVGYTTTASYTETDSVTGMTTIDLVSTKVISALTTTATTVTTTVSSVTTVTPAASGNAYCENGTPVNGLSAPCSTAPCVTFNLRIEGASDTIYEGPIYTGPQDVTTPSGGTHLCNGQNNGANAAASGTGITAIASAGGLCGFDFDGTYSSSFQDFFITRIGGTTQTSNQFWGILLNFAFPPTGGCETEPGAGQDLLWAFDAFNVNYFLDVSPKTANVAVGSTVIFTITGHDGNGDSPSPVAGASFGGLVSNANGQVVYVATQPGTYRLKATRGDSIRSPAAVITVS